MHINAHRVGFVLGVLVVVQSAELRGTAQGLPSVRVMAAEAQVFERPDVVSDVVTVTHAGAVLDLIDKQDGWYWILAGRDRNGSRQLGWIQANQVAGAAALTSLDPLRTMHEELGRLPPREAPRPIDSREAEKEAARKAAVEAQDAARDARAAARIEEAARNVEEARRKYEDLIKKPG